MRHRKKIAKLGRKQDHRKALLRNLATSLALEGKVQTTSVKAKALVAFYERLITVAKRKDAAGAIRYIKQYLFTELAQKAFINKLEDLQGNSGFLRATKVGFRPGDNAEVSLVQFVNASPSSSPKEREK